MTQEEFEKFFAGRFEYVKNSYSLELAYELNGILAGVGMAKPDWKGLGSMSGKVCKELINNSEWRRKAERWPDK